MAEQKYVSDELTHFVGKGLVVGKGRAEAEEDQFRLLLEILQTGWLLPGGYRGEFGAGVTMMGDTSERLSTNRAIRAPIVCFCDIPLECMKRHMNEYSKFGLAFTKDYMLAKGASPVGYVARNAAAPSRPGIGPGTLEEKFNLLYRELTALCFQMDEYAHGRNPTGTGGLRMTFKFSPKGTPEELDILGKLNALVTDVDEMVFSQLKFFDGRLAEDDKDNYYMEREWRKVGKLRFQLDKVSRIILPERFKKPFREALPQCPEEKLYLVED